MSVDIPLGPVSQTIKEWLIGLGVVPPDPTGENLYEAGSCFIGHRPDGEGVPDNILAIYDTGARDDGRIMRGNPVLHPTFQVVVRHDNYSGGYYRAGELYTRMSSARNVRGLDASIVIVAFTLRGGVKFMGRNAYENRTRFLFSINGSLTFN